MRQSQLALGFYQNISTAKIVAKDLQRNGLSRFAIIENSRQKGLKVSFSGTVPFFLQVSLCGAIALALGCILYFFPSLGKASWPLGALAITTIIVYFTATLNLQKAYTIDPTVINKYQACVLIDEVLIILQVKPPQVKEAIALMRHVQTGHPITFLLKSVIGEENEDSLTLPAEPQMAEHAADHAIALAKKLEKTLKKYPSSQLLLFEKMKRSEKTLHLLRHDIADAEFIEQAHTLSAEWLLDNIHVILGSFEEIKKNLSKKFYRELPKVTFSPDEELPRIYFLAIAIVQSAAGKLSKENIANFVQNYQTVTPLTIGELWALPLMLRLHLVEWIQFLALHIERRIYMGEEANFWGNRLLNALQRAPEQLNGLMDLLAKENPTPTPHFAEELIDHLFDADAILGKTKQWLETHFTSPLQDVLHEEQMNEASEQVAFSGAITSLITLSQLSWQDIFEELSFVDSVLKKDPAACYAQMDFNTRNRYREEIEHYARHSPQSEVEIANACLFLAQQGASEISKHVGYYLIDDGKEMLESYIGYSIPFRHGLKRLLKAYPAAFYLGTMALSTLGLAIAFFYSLAAATSHPPVLAALLFLAIFPLSEVVIQLLNFSISWLIPPTLLPKMLYEGDIPTELKSLIVVPMMLTSEAGVQEEVARLEIRYLANSDPSLLFGMFSDYKDAQQKHTDEDLSLICLATQEIERLDTKYGSGKFFLFHRQRTWSNSEKAWIGWERKRGKLECLNRYLMGESLAENILYFGIAEKLKDIRFIITLDSDTQLPKMQGKRLIETLSHPLNRPVLTPAGKSLERGYTIIQPMVCTDFPHTKNTWFLQIYSDPSLIDPYTHAISNVFQDLTGEGAYHGKGIYDLRAFHSILTGRYPTEHLLSHDLIEGTYVRVGFTGAVCLFDLFPEDYLSWLNRQRRWMRGDWQIFDWLFPYTPTEGGEKEKNPLSALNRWKIFDNLRRALLPAALVALLTLAWLATTGTEAFVLAAIALFLPTALQLILNLFKATSYRSFLSWHEVKLSLLRAIITTALLPQEAYYALDSLMRVAFRRMISRQLLLEWTPSKRISRSTVKTHRHFILKLTGGTLFAIALLSAIATFNPSSLIQALFFAVLWLAGPAIIEVIDRTKGKRTGSTISEEDRILLRHIARKTWRYFDDFIGVETNWLPPDNYQASLNVGIAPRTSPTNIGLWLIALLNAYDFKYITSDMVYDKIFATLTSLYKLERFEGHFLNWYDIVTLKPLYPRYISTVDSGNLLASLWTLQQGIEEIVSTPLISFPALNGIRDTFQVLLQESGISNPEKSPMRKLGELLTPPPDDFPHFITTIHKAQDIVCELVTANDSVKKPEFAYWLKALEKQLAGWETLYARYFQWIPLLNAISEEQYHLIDPDAHLWRDQALQAQFSLKKLAEADLIKSLQPLLDALSKNEHSPAIKAWGIELQAAVQTAQWLAGEKLAEFDGVGAEIEKMADAMNMRYLYSKERKILAIGYNLDDRRIDASYYDLLASEARIASLTAIAKEDIPLEHWWALSRPYGISQNVRVMLSWGGTMFEYLMPVLFNRHYADSLLGEACEAAVECQIHYGHKRGIPWGISEAAYSSIDANKIYQYRSFGVPGLGLKRGLEKDLVVSPYSSFLALAINAPEALKNIKKLTYGKNGLLGAYGYYESIDFTRQKDVHGERGVIVYTFMVHHQGMILTAINNLLHGDIIPQRFHSNPKISGVESLLFERAPLSPSITTKGSRRDASDKRLAAFSTVPIMGITETANTPIPNINLIANSEYSVMITNSGSGYSRWRDIDITRWRSDITCDPWGSYFYIRDMATGDKWSATFQPTLKEADEYSSSFKPDRTEIRRKDYGISIRTEIIVSPEDNAEIRLLTIVNRSEGKRDLAITSYQELALAPHATDRAHPAFNKLFIETEAAPELNGLIAFRRLRSKEDTPLFAAHILAVEDNASVNFEYETDRCRFIERGGSMQHPAALDHPLTNTSGTVLDPIFSLRHRFTLEPGAQIKISFINAISNNRPQLIAMMEKYKEISTTYRVMEMAWTYSQLELRHLNITQEDAQLFQKLASRLVYPSSQSRAALIRLKDNRLGQSFLWSYGISGDLPIVAISVDDIYDTHLIKQVLIAHKFWRLRGLKTDLLILNEEKGGYQNPLQDQLETLIHAYGFGNNVSGGVFLKSLEQISAEELTLLLSSASVFLVASRGSLRQQLITPFPDTHYPSDFTPDGQHKENASSNLPFLELPFFNNLGGYSSDGKTYSIYLGPHAHTPAPWVNVIANPQFGTLVTEGGNGTTWYDNSQTNRLTPWSNDPILNPIADAIYIKDQESGIFWTPTPSPIRELDAYRINHGQGFTTFEHNSHGIEQQLSIFVPMDKKGGLPLRIQRLLLRNTSAYTRSFTITAFSELILGTNKEETQMHVQTEWDEESQSLFANNYYNPHFGGYTAFASSMPLAASYTGDRTEFLGRNGTAADPAALNRSGLSNCAEPGLDPCLALQIKLTIPPGESREAVFTLGYAPSAAHARNLISQTRFSGSVDKMFTATQGWWDDLLGALQIKVPDLIVNFAVNRWLLYQCLSCRIWGRTGFYQSSGAYGFRDQLQDVLALVYSQPEIAKDHILKTAARQFLEGDVQHWWHAESGGGIRTRYSDDLLWLPFAAAQYVRTTGDVSILQEEVPFLKGPLLEEDQHEIYSVPEITSEKASLLEHCHRALKKGLTAGPHGLPLIGGGDWNDGMNRVGIQGRGESVWLAWFLIHVMHDFTEMLTTTNYSEPIPDYAIEAERLAAAIEARAWDGAWYRRAYYDNGSTLGSSSNQEASIDSLAQSWAVISGGGDAKRSDIALQSAYEKLVRVNERVVRLLTPPFDRTPEDPGYIKGYPPGVRENGGQYTHGSLWLASAFAKKGDGNRAVELLQMMHPHFHTRNQLEIDKYKGEPYATAGDVYDLAGQVGRGGWTWYTGSCGWMYRIWLEDVLGFKLRGDKLSFHCAIPKEWDGFKIHYRYKTSHYNIEVANPAHISRGSCRIEFDGVIIKGKECALVDDGNIHLISVTIEKDL